MSYFRHLFVKMVMNVVISYPDHQLFNSSHLEKNEFGCFLHIESLRGKEVLKTKVEFPTTAL